MKAATAFNPRVELPVIESYYTLQGEGFNAGKAAYFIRLAGCDVGCVWCDVKESWEVADEQRMSIDAIISKVKLEANGCKNVVITGGEPLMYNLDELCEALHKQDFKLWLETSGAYPLSGKWDWVCVSPKKFKAPLEEVLLKADELKVV